MIPLRVLAALAALVAVGVGIDAVSGASILGYGAGLGASGVVVLTVVSGLVGRALRRGVDTYDTVDLPSPPAGDHEREVDR